MHKTDSVGANLENKILNKERCKYYNFKLIRLIHSHDEGDSDLTDILCSLECLVFMCGY